MVKGLGQIAVTVKDLERMTSFYERALGLKLLFRVPGMSFFDLGGVRLMLGIAERPELLHAASILYYRVDDIQAASRELAARGATPEHEPRLAHRDGSHELWLAFFRDPEENLLALMSEVPSAQGS